MRILLSVPIVASLSFINWKFLFVIIWTFVSIIVFIWNHGAENEIKQIAKRIQRRIGEIEKQHVAQYLVLESNEMRPCTHRENFRMERAEKILNDKVF